MIMVNAMIPNFFQGTVLNSQLQVVTAWTVTMRFFAVEVCTNLKLRF